VIGVGRVLLWSGGSIWIGREAGVAQAHSHHAIQITLALTGTVRLCHDGQAWRDYTGAVVMPHHRHQFDGCGNDTAMIFVEPETVQGQALLALLQHPGELTLAWTRGVRKPYVAPFQLFLIANVLFFALQSATG